MELLQNHPVEVISAFIALLLSFLLKRVGRERKRIIVILLELLCKVIKAMKVYLSEGNDNKGK
jgi:hypothetical protein